MSSPIVRRLSAPPAIMASFVRNLALRRHLIWNFVVRDLKVRYVGSLMGFFWAVIHPLVLLVSYTFVFAVVFKVKVPEPVPANFPIYLFCGILPWLYFQDTLLRSSTAVVDNSNLIRKTIFPSEILPVTVVLSNLVTHLVGFAILLLCLVYLGTLGWPALLLPVYLFLLALLSLGLGWLFAAMQVFLRDTSQVLSVALILWFWFTPIFYQASAVPKPFAPLLRLNPLGYVVEGYRDLLLLGRLPDPASLGWLTLAALVAFFAGGFVFRNVKREFVDVL